jgi:hypothetical protein
MVALLSEHLQVLTLHQSKCQTFIHLLVFAMSWTIVCNQEQEKFQNGNLDLGWVYTLDILLLTSNVSNVGLILNPRTGHVSPQFHVVYDDDFTMVPYLCTAAVPPHWAEFVEASSHFEVYTERQAGTWQSLPELDVDPGDFTSDTSEMLNPTIKQDCEGEEHSEAVSNVESPHDTTNVNKQVTFSDNLDYEIHNKSPDEYDSQPNEW